MRTTEGDPTEGDGELREEAAAYFRRSYAAVDGLWFMKAEERLGFDSALELDREVWKVLPKIQARILKEQTGATGGLEALHRCLTTRLRWEEYSFQAEPDAQGRRLDIRITDCPWHRLMVKSGREHLAGRVGRCICGQEYAAWAAEFGGGIRFDLVELLCEGAEACLLTFREG